MAKRNVKIDSMNDIYTNKELRRKVFKNLLTHVREGYSIDCYSPLSADTITLFLTKFPDEFIGTELEKALRDGKQMWEGIGIRQSDGRCLGNSRSWYYNMMNRYGWSDKAQVKQEHSGSIKVEVVNYADTSSSNDIVE